FQLLTSSTLSPYTTLFRSSLCGNPALRWVIACASRSWSANACPAKRTGPGSGAIAHVGQRLVGVELADDVEVADQRLADFVIDRDRKSTRLNSSHVKISYA